VRRLVLILALPAASVAQTAEQAKPAAPAKPTHQWSAKLTGGVRFSRGQTDGNDFIVVGEVVRKGEARSYHITGNLSFSSVLAPGGNQRFTSTDRRYADFFFLQKLTPRLSFVTRTSIEHDYASGLRYRAEELAGLGVALLRGERAKLMVTPGAVVGIEDKLGVHHNSGYSGPGVYETATVQLNKVWSLRQWVMYRWNARDSHDYRLDGSIGLTGFVITRRLGVNFTYTQTYDGRVSPGLLRGLAKFTTGLQYAYP
jgi:hypothetical protein